MGLVIGIDVGGSTTKIVGLNNGQILSPMFITAADPITSLFGAFGKYIYDNGITLNDIEHVMLTGVGSSGVTTPIYGLPTSKADEFQADGLGARFDSGLDKLTVVSMGTGTTLVSVDGDNISHLGGIGIGGGTLMGLAHLLLKTDHVSDVIELASKATSLTSTCKSRTSARPTSRDCLCTPPRRSLARCAKSPPATMM